MKFRIMIVWDADLKKFGVSAPIEEGSVLCLGMLATAKQMIVNELSASKHLIETPEMVPGGMGRG